ncbi:hypothetical protein H8B15_18920 [Hymenobacter sp. BT507]|uniref:Uncharacterized protein n=1 Tax=Hymenobacter citatus TaxID=2763506 RepID=A0ABR7MR06_9BACT|nr:hypothetical protein [Hymenobacter citatus]MBC6613002.1 hypothetical protein [Hymenobacter citatus]
MHLHFTLPNPGPTAEQALADAPAFAGATGEPDARGRIRHTYRGLRLEYRPGQYKGRVRGSLHTFAQGNNLGTFTAADVARAVAELAEALAIPPEALLVKWLEVGVNLTVPTAPRPFLEQL